MTSRSKYSPANGIVNLMTELEEGRYALTRELCNECREGGLVPKVKGLIEQ
jgi:hypothetical protein